jgi:hypothetical protein
MVKTMLSDFKALKSCYSLRKIRKYPQAIRSKTRWLQYSLHTWLGENDNRNRKETVGSLNTSPCNLLSFARSLLTNAASMSSSRIMLCCGAILNRWFSRSSDKPGWLRFSRHIAYCNSPDIQWTISRLHHECKWKIGPHNMLSEMRTKCQAQLLVRQQRRLVQSQCKIMFKAQVTGLTNFTSHCNTV